MWINSMEPYGGLEDLTVLVDHPPTEADQRTEILDARGIPVHLMPTIEALPNNYRIQNPLGASDGHHVYLAGNDMMNKFYVIKLVRGVEQNAVNSDASTPPGYRRVLQNEAELLQHLTGGPITPFHEFITEIPCLVTEYIAGESLYDYLRHHPLEAPGIHSITLGLAQAVKYLHDRGIVHRDIKPPNVILMQGERTAPVIVLADFETAQTTQTSNIHIECPFPWVGTKKYMSPEQQRADPAHPAMDIYSLGMTFRDIYLRNRDLVTADAVKLFRGMTAERSKRLSIDQVIEELHLMKTK